MQAVAEQIEGTIEVCRYTIISGTELENISRGVLQASRNGWKPQGGICIQVESTGFPVYHQAMIRVVLEMADGSIPTEPGISVRGV